MEKQERQGPAKPSEDELLAYLDGELEAKRRAEIELMRETDWELRADLSRVERRIEMFIEATAHQSPAAIPTVEEFWQDFTDRRRDKSIDAPVQSETGINLFTTFSVRRGLFAQLREWSATAFSRRPEWPRLPRLVAALAAGLVVVTAFSFFFLRTERLVSAEELLRLAAQAESVRMDKIAEPVVYRRLKVRRRVAGREESVTWESWKDVKGDRFRQRVAGDRGTRFSDSGERFAPEIVAELEHIFQANHLDAQRPLSVAGYEAWRKAVPVQKRSESVTEATLPGSQAGLKLTTTVEGPYAVNTITEASLVVRWSNWHTVAQQLKVQGEGDIREYELSEMAYEVVPRQALTAFPELAAATQASPALSPSPLHASPSATPMPSEAALREAEVAALYALHQLQADLSGQIEIVRDSGGQVVAQGLVETAERKRQLIDALGRIPFVVTQIQTVEEAAQQKASSRSPAAPASTAGPGSETVIAASGNNAFQQRLARYFVEREDSPQRIQQRVAQLSKGVVSEANTALSEAWALRRLAARFTAGWGEELPSEANQHIEEMTRNHIARLKAHCRNLRAQLEPALVEIAGERAAAVNSQPEPSPQAQALLIFKSVEQVNQLTHKLFAGTGLLSETPEQSARQLLNALSRLDGVLSF